MNNFKCQNLRHNLNDITKVCMDKNCQLWKLCCCYCVKQQHSSHLDKIVNVSQLNDYLQQLSNHYANQQQRQIINGLETLSQQIDIYQKLVQEELDLMYKHNFQEYLRKFRMDQQGPEYWNQLIQRISENLGNDDLYSATQMIQKNFDFIKEEDGNISMQIIRKAQESLDQMINSFSSVNQLYFTENFIKIQGPSLILLIAVISQDGKIIASGSINGVIQLWNGQTKKLLQTIKQNFNVYRVAISSDNQFLALAGSRIRHSLIQLYKIKHKYNYAQLIGHKNNIRNLTYSQDCKLLLSGDNEQLIVWNLQSKKRIISLKTDSSLMSFIISCNKLMISYICKYGQIYIMNFQSKAIQVFETDDQWGSSLCSSYDSKTFFSCGNTIKVWRLSNSGENQKSLTLLKTIEQANSQKKFTQVKLTSDEKYIIALCGLEGKILIFELKTGKLIESLIKSNNLYCAPFSITNDANVVVTTTSDNLVRIWIRIYK